MVASITSGVATFWASAGTRHYSVESVMLSWSLQPILNKGGKRKYPAQPSCLRRPSREKKSRACRDRWITTLLELSALGIQEWDDAFSMCDKRMKLTVDQWTGARNPVVMAETAAVMLEAAAALAK